MFKQKILFKIVYYPSEILGKNASDVVKITNDTRDFIANLIYTMDESDGVGIAAPQVGVSQKIIICRLSTVGDTVLINPKISEKSVNTVVGLEGCLSLPGLYGYVACATEVTVEYQNYKGRSQKITAEGNDARILQHEIAHLEGKTILDTALKDSFVWITDEEDEDGNPIHKPVSFENAKIFFEKNGRNL